MTNLLVEQIALLRSKPRAAPTPWNPAPSICDISSQQDVNAESLRIMIFKNQERRSR
jgi:hypothetical protein